MFNSVQRATGICRYLLCSSLLSVIVEIKSSLVAYGVPYGFLDLDRDSWTVLTLLPWATYDCVQGWFGASVFEMKTFEPDSKIDPWFGACEAGNGESHV